MERFTKEQCVIIEKFITKIRNVTLRPFAYLHLFSLEFFKCWAHLNKAVIIPELKSEIQRVIVEIQPYPEIVREIFMKRVLVVKGSFRSSRLRLPRGTVLQHVLGGVPVVALCRSLTSDPVQVFTEATVPGKDLS